MAWQKQNNEMKKSQILCDTEMQSFHILGLLDFKDGCKKTGHIRWKAECLYYATHQEIEVEEQKGKCMYSHS